VGASVVPATYAVGNGIGQGVSADSVTRIRDSFMESRAQVEHATTAQLTETQSTYTQVEDAFHEPGDTGLQKQLAGMWSAWGDVANNSTSGDGGGARAEVLTTTAGVVDSLHTVSATLDTQWSQDRDSLGALVADVNASATSIAGYNSAIKRATQAGLPSNELQDKRDALVLKLSEQIGATSVPGDDGAVTVNVPGATLVQGGNALGLELVGSTDPDDAGNRPKIITAPGGTPITPGGTAAGQLTAMTTIIPAYKAQLDGVAQQLATQLNAVHQAGWDMDGNPGKALLTDGAGGTTVTAASIRLAISDPDELAASATDPATVGGRSTSDGTNADRIGQLKSKSDGADNVYRKMIVALGVQSSSAANNLTAQSAISTQVDASRESVSGVSIDEEMTNMLQFQHAYSAAAKVITTIDDTIQTLLNMVGN